MCDQTGSFRFCAGASLLSHVLASRGGGQRFSKGISDFGCLAGDSLISESAEHPLAGNQGSQVGCSKIP